jgi:hypothetical protein
LNPKNFVDDLNSLLIKRVTVILSKWGKMSFFLVLFVRNQ